MTQISTPEAQNSEENDVKQTEVEAKDNEIGDRVEAISSSQTELEKNGSDFNEVDSGQNPDNEPSAEGVDEAEVRQRSNSIDQKKKKLIQEINDDPDLYERPQKSLIDAITKHQTEEKDAYNDLIKQNVELTRENRKLSEQVQEQSAQNEVMKVDLQTEQEKSNDLEKKLETMEGELKALVKAAQKRGISRPATSAEEQNIEENNTPEGKKIKEQTKVIQSLQYRLIRLTADMEKKEQEHSDQLRDKDKQIVQIWQRSQADGAMDMYSEAVEESGALNPEKLQELLEQAEVHREEIKTIDQRGNVIRQDDHAQSAVCVIL